MKPWPDPREPRFVGAGLEMAVAAFLIAAALGAVIWSWLAG